MRCFWVNLNNKLYVDYHDNEWGVPLHDDGKLFELLILECFQAGLSWECVLNKRSAFRRAFDGFDITKVSMYGNEKIAELAKDASIIRHRLKIEAAVTNAKVFLSIQQQYGSFDKYIWSFTDGKVLFEPCDTQTTSPLSDKISKDLRRRGMRFTGSTVIYSFFQAAGIINGHQKNCDFLNRSNTL